MLTGVWQEIVLVLVAIGLLFPKWYEFDKWKVILGSHYEDVHHLLQNQYVRILITFSATFFICMRRINIKNEKIQSLEKKIEELEKSLSSKSDKGSVYMFGNIINHIHTSCEGVASADSNAEFSFSQLKNLG